MTASAASRWLHLTAVCLAWLSQSSRDGGGAHAAAVCASTGLPSPDVPTLMISPLAWNQVWVISPDCDKLAVPPDSFAQFTIGEKGIERVVSLPKDFRLDLTGNPLTGGADFSNLTFLSLTRFAPEILNKIVFPAAGAIALVNSPLTLKLLKAAVFPSATRGLILNQTQVKSLNGFMLPSSLTDLQIVTNKLASIDFLLPPLLKSLTIKDSLITKFERVVLPDTLVELDLNSNKISVVKGVVFPSTLQMLTLEGNPLVEFEVRESDFGVFDLYSVIGGDFSQVKCTDPTAKLKPFLFGGVCVISDERFATLYGATTTSPTPSTTKKPSSTKNGSTASTASDEASGEEDESNDTAGSDSSGVGTATKKPTSKPRQSSASGSRSASGEATSTNTSSVAPTQSDTSQGGSPSSSKTTVINSTKASSSTVVTVIAVLGGLIALVVGAWIYHVCILSKKKRKKSHDDTTTAGYARAETPGGSALEPTGSTAPSQEYLVNDIRNDKSMLAVCIDQSAIKFGKQIARGGYGVIYRAKHDGQDVAVKQMLPGTWQDTRTLASFMDEIRLCASLDHPKIVAFVGIAYSSLRDLSVVIEFMPGGDLYALLLAQQKQPRSMEDWSRPWTSSQIKCKASIGQDVAEAVAYLHSRESPIIHRDLKARNVLLDLQGNAKLSDFGISRELTIDETMTSGIGTAAWIAPEVLRGARYDEKADVYSLGVLLVELDRCQHPYADEPVLQKYSGPNDGTTSVRRSSMSHAAHKNTQIAVLVSTGKLRPSVSRECPDPVATLVAQCLSFDPQQRPSAHEVASALSSAMKESI